VSRQGWDLALPRPRAPRPLHHLQILHERTPGRRAAHQMRHQRPRVSSSPSSWNREVPESASSSELYFMLLVATSPA